MMSAEIPSTMRAVVVQKVSLGGLQARPGGLFILVPSNGEDRTVAVEDRPIPVLGENEILVKVEAVAQNPTDWKHVKYVTRAPGNILGCDFSGTVVRVGGGCSRAADVGVGRHVAGFTQGGHFKERGAFAEYLKADSDLVWSPVVAGNTLEHYEAATMGCGLWTAVQALFHPTRLGLTEPPAKTTSQAWLFIYGGSTSVGQYAIQLAHAAGYKIATVASPHNHALVKSLGADVVFDYRASDVVSAVRNATGDGVEAAFDTIGRHGSQPLCVHVVRAAGGGRVVTLNPVEAAVKNMRGNVEVKFTMIYTALDRPFTLEHHYPASAEDRAHMAGFLLKLPQLVAGGVVKPHKKVRLWAGGLAGVEDGLRFMMEGNVSAEKIVYRL